MRGEVYGLAFVIWSYPRGGNLSPEGETAIDICAYAAQLGAHIIKVKPPTQHLELAAAKGVYEKQKIDISAPAARIRHVVQSAFNRGRIVVFSGGEAKDLDGVFAEVRAVRDGGGNGSISAATPSSGRRRRRWTCSQDHQDLPRERLSLWRNVRRWRRRDSI